MKFWTIWTLSYLPLGERLLRTRDWAAMKVARRLPLRLRYWTTIIEIGHATRHSPEVPATPCHEILQGLRSPSVVR